METTNTTFKTQVVGLINKVVNSREDNTVTRKEIMAKYCEARGGVMSHSIESAVNKAFAKLTTNGYLLRIGRGIYKLNTWLIY